MYYLTRNRKSSTKLLPLRTRYETDGGLPRPGLTCVWGSHVWLSKCPRYLADQSKGRGCVSIRNLNERRLPGARRSLRCRGFTCSLMLKRGNRTSRTIAFRSGLGKRRTTPSLSLDLRCRGGDPAQVRPHLWDHLGVCYSREEFEFLT
jgi:hypothetical protein